MQIDYPRLMRLLTRCEELATATDTDPAVARVHRERLAPEAGAFRSAYDALPAAETTSATERREAHAALDRIDQPFRKARAIAKAYVSELSTPDTLKTLRTDTDRLLAIEALLDTLEERAEGGAEWAREELAGAFGTLAPDVIRELGEVVAADAQLSSARDARARAYGPAYERYLHFKNVVRQAYGARSPQYRRIHIRQIDRETEPTE
ncbi:hypothetical protein [Sandaracinus amylolyticus]|uniref:hypothetical protein n=1 Tax=Sandaracinus amylolyticus TaxID=927083 RepID=UPI001F3555A6|nr:hypothetical protein [Sandaracinus amylolyticus]UJR79135.1 Hypothetical protein I5071_11680 [Sandaracinus amylolyticus]